MKEKIGKEEQIEELARQLEEPRALRLLAEWLAIEHDKTRLQGDEYMEAAQELYDYLLIIGFRLIPLLIEEIRKGRSTNPYSADEDTDEFFAFDSACVRVLKALEGMHDQSNTGSD